MRIKRGDGNGGDPVRSPSGGQPYARRLIGSWDPIREITHLGKDRWLQTAPVGVLARLALLQESKGKIVPFTIVSFVFTVAFF